MDEEKYYVCMGFLEKNARSENMDDFIKHYSECYFLGTESFVPGINQSQKWIEEDMKRLLDGKNIDIKEEDVVHILAWKMGRINHKESTENNKYRFTGHGW